jgi:hypothetical protein
MPSRRAGRIVTASSALRCREAVAMREHRFAHEVECLEVAARRDDERHAARREQRTVAQRGSAPSDAAVPRPGRARRAEHHGDLRGGDLVEHEVESCASSSTVW